MYNLQSWLYPLDICSSHAHQVVNQQTKDSSSMLVAAAYLDQFILWFAMWMIK